MSHVVRAVRNIGGTLYERTLELPVEPVAGHLVHIEPQHPVAIRDVHVFPLPSPWAPGLKAPSVHVWFVTELAGIVPCDIAVEPRQSRERATASGWREVIDG